MLTRLYSSLFDEDIGSGDYGHAKSSVIDVIEAVLDQHNELWGQSLENEEAATDTRAKANLTYNFLKTCGWLEESRHGYHDYVAMMPRVSQLLAALMEIAEGRPLIMTGKLKSLRSGIREVLDSPSQGADTLIELAKEAGRFTRHLNSIRSSIKELYDQIRSDIAVRDVVTGFFDSFLREIFIRDYATIKTTENPLTIRDEIITILTKLRYTADVKNVLLKGYIDIYGNSDQSMVEQHLDRDLSRLEYVFLNVEKQFDAIDQMKVRYEQRVDTVIKYAIRSPRTIGRDLKRLVDALNRHDKQVKEEIDVLLPLCMREGIGESRFSPVRRARLAPSPRKVRKRSVSQEIIEHSRQERASRKAVYVDEAALLEFLNIQIGNNRTDESHRLIINNVRDYFCVLNIQRAARMPEMTKKLYPILSGHFAFNITDEWVENDYLKIHKVIITKRGAV